MQLQYMIGQYDYRLVVLSVVVSISAAYAALALAGRVASKRHEGGKRWLAGGAIAIGTGVWAMHFVGMLAFKLPIPMGYDFGLTLATWLLGVSACGVALYVTSRTALTIKRVVFGSAYMGAGLAGMHYLGMYAMLMQPHIVYSPWLVLASLAIAFGASAAALVIVFEVLGKAGTRRLVHVASAVVIGVALACMHYTAMAAANFPLGSICGAATQMDTTLLASLIGVATLFFLGSALVASVLDRRYEIRNAQFIDSLRKANSEPHAVKLHDPLTGLPARPLLSDRIEQSLGHWQQKKSRSTEFAVIWVDIDNFKDINSAIGTQLGDRLLRQIAHVIADVAYRNDTVSRVGDDKFALVLHDLHNRGPVDPICQDLLDRVCAIDTGGHPLSASIGSATCPVDGTQASDLITAAEIAMYAVKMAGKNGYRSYHADMSGQSSEESALEQELNNAIHNGELVIYYQPKYSVQQRELIGAEALVRWQHPDRGLVPPDHFIPLAERRGLITELDHHVLDQVCGQIRKWLDAGFDVPPIAVNMSAAQMRVAGLPQRIQSCLNDYNMVAEQLNIEVTETLAMEDIDQAIETLNGLREIGIQIALDDFGTGFSSLSYLTQLPIQKLKIDRSFIWGLAPNNTDQARIVQGIISLAHALRLRVIAEGVETEEQMAYLVEFQCDEVQGYLLNRPLPADRFISELQAVHSGRQIPA